MLVSLQNTLTDQKSSFIICCAYVCVRVCINSSTVEVRDQLLGAGSLLHCGSGIHKLKLRL